MTTVDVSQVLNLLVMAADDGDLNAVKYLAHKAEYLANQCVYNVNAPEPEIDIREAFMRGARGGDEPYKAENPVKVYPPFPPPSVDANRIATMSSCVSGTCVQPKGDHREALRRAARKFNRKQRNIGNIKVRVGGKYVWRKATDTAWTRKPNGYWARLVKDCDEFRTYVANGGAYFPGEVQRPTVAAMRSIANRFSREEA